MFRFHLSVVVIFIFNFLFCSNEDFNISTSRQGSFNPTSTIAIDKYQIELGINNNSNDLDRAYEDMMEQRRKDVNI